MKTGGRVEIFGTILAKQNGIHEEIKKITDLRKCLLPFGRECFVIPFPIQKHKDEYVIT